MTLPPFSRPVRQPRGARPASGLGHGRGGRGSRALAGRCDPPLRSPVPAVAPGTRGSDAPRMHDPQWHGDTRGETPPPASPEPRGPASQGLGAGRGEGAGKGHGVGDVAALGAPRAAASAGHGLAEATTASPPRSISRWGPRGPSPVPSHSTHARPPSLPVPCLPSPCCPPAAGPRLPQPPARSVWSCASEQSFGSPYL